MMLTESQIKEHFAPHMAEAATNKFGKLFDAAVPLNLTTKNIDIVIDAEELGEHARKEVMKYFIGEKSNNRPPEYPFFTNKDDEIVFLRKRLEAALRITNEYDQLIRHMDGGGDFFEFMARCGSIP
jgi:hypothetical protein